MRSCVVTDSSPLRYSGNQYRQSTSLVSEINSNVVISASTLHDTRHQIRPRCFMFATNVPIFMPPDRTIGAYCFCLVLFWTIRDTRNKRNPPTIHVGGNVMYSHVPDRLHRRFNKYRKELK